MAFEFLQAVGIIGRVIRPVPAGLNIAGNY